MIGHLAENPPRFLGGREIKGQWREKRLNLAARVRPKHLESEFHSFNDSYLAGHSKACSRCCVSAASARLLSKPHKCKFYQVILKSKA
jgi:hypothetical protein